MSFNQTLKFIFQWAFYFLIEIAYAPPNFNMVEGCYDAWYLFVMQFLIIEDVNEEAAGYPDSDLRLVPFIEKFTFAYFTLLEFPYKQVAYCNQGIWDIGTKFSEVRDMILWDAFQIVYNVIRKIGTISYSFITFWDCFQRFDGTCAGIHSGRFFYYIFDIYNYWDTLKN